MSTEDIATVEYNSDHTKSNVQNNDGTTVQNKVMNTVQKNVSFNLLNEIMKFIVIIDLIILLLLVLVKDVPIYGEWMFYVHRYVLLVHGFLNSYKGWIIDGSILFALHHTITTAFFYYTTSSNSGFTVYKYMFNMCLYLVMKIFKRLTDEGRFTKEQWMMFYAGYAHVQGLSLIYSMVWEREYIGLIDTVGYLALFDSFITCRKHNLGGQLFEKTNLLFPLTWLENTIIHNVLSVIDFLSLCSILLCANYNTMSQQTLGEMVLTLGNYKGLIALLLIDMGIKPLFKGFKRPHTYKYIVSGSFPSSHVALVMIASAQIHNPLLRMVFIFSNGLYRISSRAHTLDDVAAGVAVGSIFALVWESIFGGF